MKRLIIKLRTDERSRATELEVPGETPAGEVMAHLVDGMGWASRDAEGPKQMHWFEVNGAGIPLAMSLTQAGVKNGDTVFARSGDALPSTMLRIEAKASSNALGADKLSRPAPARRRRESSQEVRETPLAPRHPGWEPTSYPEEGEATQRVARSTSKGDESR